MHGTFFCDFPGFPGFPVLVGTLVYGYSITALTSYSLKLFIQVVSDSNSDSLDFNAALLFKGYWLLLRGFIWTI